MATNPITSNNQSIFDFEGKEVRTVMQNNEPYFILTDICRVLEIGNSSDVVKRLDEDEVDYIEVIDSLNRKQLAWAVNESGLYEMLLTSRKEEAKKFKRWVKREVLPSIRKTGVYVNPYLNMSPVQLLENALKMAKENESLLMVTQQQQRQITVLEPKAEIYDQFIASDDDITIAEFAKINKFKNRQGDLIGRNNMFKLLRKLEILQPNNEPYQKYMKHFNVKIKPVVINGKVQNISVPLLTSKGQEWLYKRLKEYLK